MYAVQHEAELTEKALHDKLEKEIFPVIDQLISLRLQLNSITSKPASEAFCSTIKGVKDVLDNYQRIVETGLRPLPPAGAGGGNWGPQK